jgi:hypothetical protein
VIKDGHGCWKGVKAKNVCSWSFAACRKRESESDKEKERQREIRERKSWRKRRER